MLISIYKLNKFNQKKISPLDKYLKGLPNLKLNNL